MSLGWLAVGVPLLAFLVFGVGYTVAGRLAGRHVRGQLDLVGQYVYLGVVLVVAATAVVLALRTAGPEEPAGLERLGVTLPTAGWLPIASWLVVALAALAGLLVGIGTYLGELVASAYLARLLAVRAANTAAASVGERTGREGGAGSIHRLVEGHSPDLLDERYRLAPMVATGLVTATAEELVFRGGLLDFVRSGIGLPLALTITAVTFGSTHAFFGLRNVLLKTVSGGVWGMLAVLFGSLLPALVAHLAFQGLVFRRLRVRREVVTAGAD